MADVRIEQLIIDGLVTNQEYCRKVLPFLKHEYFSNPAEREVFGTIVDLFTTYNKPPVKAAIKLKVQENTDIPEKLFDPILRVIDNIKPLENPDGFEGKEIDKVKWLVDGTEKFCKDKALYNAVAKSISIMDGEDKNHSTGAIPQLLQDALSVGFDHAIGHDYLASAEARYEFYHRDEERIPFKLKLLNQVTKGGVPNKSLNIILAGTGVGKTLFMCDWAAYLISIGINVLYITMEMSEERISERIDGNLMDATLDDIGNMSKDMYLNRFQKVKERAKGNLMVKEYPTSTASSAHFRALINELRIKKGFVPQIVFIDYINICSSVRFKPGAEVNSYRYVKAIAEELRGLGVEFDIPIVSATQTTRSGFTNTDIELDETSESWGLPQTADFFIALISSEELITMNQVMVKQLKNRYGNPNLHKRFTIGVNYDKMKFYDLEASAQIAGKAAIEGREEERSTSAITKDFLNRKPPIAKNGIEGRKRFTRFQT